MSRALSRTMKLPNTEKPFQCNVCEKQFRQLSTLANHMKIHTGEKPFKCHICSREFRQSSTLTNHIKIHTGMILNRLINYLC
ncbi:hypothetical protein ACKWTF_003777 [Chironomus riparius]